MSVSPVVIKVFGSVPLLTILMATIAFGIGSGHFPFGSPAGTRTHQFSVTCCDITNTLWDSSSEARNAIIPTSQTQPGVRHYEYVFPDGTISV